MTDSPKYPEYKPPIIGDVFTLLPEHLTLWSELRVEWNPTEAGAPGISVKRPYGNSNVLADLRAILHDRTAICHECGHAVGTQRYTDTDLWLLHREMVIVLEIAILTGTVRAGAYRCTGARRWQDIAR